MSSKTRIHRYFCCSSSPTFLIHICNRCDVSDSSRGSYHRIHTHSTTAPRDSPISNIISKIKADIRNLLMAPFSKSEIPIEDDSADDILDVLGYQSELTRSRSTLQVAFMSFVLAAVPYGLATTLYYPLVGGGPVSVIWGWIGVCSIMACLAVSLGEITSVYPTAGGVYYQTFMLSPTWCRNVAAWICGWSYFLGNMLITLSVNFGTTLYLIGCINIFTDSEGNGIFPAKQYETVLIFFGITIVCNATSSLGNKWLPLLDVSDSMFSSTRLTFLDICCFLDLYWSHCYYRMYTCYRKRRSSQRSICFWSL